MNKRIGKWVSVLAFCVIAMSGAAVSAITMQKELFVERSARIRPDGLPEITYLGEGPGTFEIDPLHTFVVKYRRNDYKEIPGPDYQAVPGERVWGFDFVPLDTVILYDEIHSFGQVVAGDTIAFALIDDDVDERTSQFYIDDELVYDVSQGMVVYGTFAVPRSGELLFTSQDGVGIFIHNNNGGTPTPFPTVASTATPTPTSTPPAPQNMSHVFVHSWGGDIGIFNHLFDISIWENKLFILDKGKLTVEVFDEHGTPLYAFPLSLPAVHYTDFEFSPVGIEVDPSGFVFVIVDAALAKYTPDGRLLNMWMIDLIGGVQGFAISNDNSVYLSSGSNQIFKYTKDFEYITKWGWPGSDSGQFSNPGDLAVDKEGNVYVVDQDNYRIQKFTSAGVYISQWGQQGNENGQFMAPNDISVTANGFVYVTDSMINRVQRFNIDGIYVSQWDSLGTEQDRFNGIDGIAASNDRVFVGDYGAGRIYKFTGNGDYLIGWGSKGTDEGQFSYPMGIAIDDHGAIYVADRGNDRVQKFTSDGSYVKEWGNAGSNPGEFQGPRGIEVDKEGYVYVLDSGNSRVQKFSADGEFLLEWGSKGTGPGQFSTPWDLAIDKMGFVYVVDLDTDEIQKFTAAGEFVMKWSHSESGNKVGIAVDAQGYVYTVDVFTVQKFTSEGVFVTEWGTWGDGAGQFVGPQGITVDNKGRVYVVDTWNRRIQVFTSDGDYISEFGSFGSSDGQLLTPLRAVVATDGSVLVVDNRLGRIQTFALDRPPVHLESGLISNGSFEINPSLSNWTYGHNFDEPSISVTNIATDGEDAVMLGHEVPQEAQNRGTAWIYQTIFVRPDWDHPLLSFDYRMFVNDTVDFSDFYVWISSPQGSWKATVLRDGFRSCSSPATAPPERYDLGWRSIAYDLSRFKGHTIRVRFENRNLHQNLSLGIWTYVDNVRVLDSTTVPLPIGKSVYLPVVTYEMCDRVR